MALSGLGVASLPLTIPIRRSSAAVSSARVADLDVDRHPDYPAAATPQPARGKPSVASGYGAVGR